MSKLTEEERITEEAKIDNFFAKKPSKGYYTYNEIYDLLKGKTLEAAIEISDEFLADNGNGFVETVSKYKNEKLVLGIYAVNNESESDIGKEDSEHVWYNTLKTIINMFLSNKSIKADEIYQAYNKIAKRPNKDPSFFLTNEEIKKIVDNPKDNYFEKSINAIELFLSMRFNYEYKDGSFEKCKSRFVKDMAKIYRKSSFNLNANIYNFKKAILKSTDGQVNILSETEIKSYEIGGNISEEEYIANLIINYDCNEPDQFENIYKEVTSKYGDYSSYKNISEIYEYCTNNPLLVMDYSVEDYKNSRLTSANKLINELIEIKFGEGTDGLNKKVAGVLLDKKYPISTSIEGNFNDKFGESSLSNLLEFVSGEPATGWKKDQKPIIDSTEETTDSTEETISEEETTDSTDENTEETVNEEKIDPTKVIENKILEEKDDFHQEDTSNKRSDGKDSNYLNVDRYWNFNNNVSSKVEIQFRLTLDGKYGWHSLDDLLNRMKEDRAGSVMTPEVMNNNCFVSMNMVDNGAKRVELVLFDRNFVDIEQILSAAINELQSSMGSATVKKNVNVDIKNAGSWEGKIETDAVSSNMRIRFGYQDKNIKLTNHSYSGFGSAIRDEEGNAGYPRWRELSENKLPETDEGFIDKDISDGINFKYKFQQSTIRSTWSEFFINGLSSTLTDTGVRYSVSGISVDTMKLSGYKMVQRYAVLKGKPLQLLDSFVKNFKNMVQITYDDEVETNIDGTDIFYDYEKGEYVKVNSDDKDREIKNEMVPLESLKKYSSQLKNLKATLIKDNSNTIRDCIGGSIDIKYDLISSNLEEFDKDDSKSMLKIELKTPIGIMAYATNLFLDETDKKYSDITLKELSAILRNISQLWKPFLDFCYIEGIDLDKYVKINYKHFCIMLLSIIGFEVYSGLPELSTWGSTLKSNTENGRELSDEFEKLSSLCKINDNFPAKWRFARDETNENPVRFPIDNICDNGIKGIVTNESPGGQNVKNLYYPGKVRGNDQYNGIYSYLNNDNKEEEGWFPKNPNQTNKRIIDSNVRASFLYKNGYLDKLNECRIEARIAEESKLLKAIDDFLETSKKNINIFSNVSLKNTYSYEPLENNGVFSERRDIYRLALKETTSSEKGLTIKKVSEISSSYESGLILSAFEDFASEDGKFLLDDSHQWLAEDGIYYNKGWSKDHDTAKTNSVSDFMSEQIEDGIEITYNSYEFTSGIAFFYFTGKTQFTLSLNIYKGQGDDIKERFVGRMEEVAKIFINSMLMAHFVSEYTNASYLYLCETAGSNIVKINKVFTRPRDIDNIRKGMDINLKYMLSVLKERMVSTVFNICKLVKENKEKSESDNSSDMDEINKKNIPPLKYLIEKEKKELNTSSIALKEFYITKSSMEEFSYYPAPNAKNLMDCEFKTLKELEQGSTQKKDKISKKSNKVETLTMYIDTKINAVQKEIEARLKKIEGWNSLNIGKEIEISLGNQYSRDSENSKEEKKKRWKSLSSIFNEFCSKCPTLIDSSELIASGISISEDGEKQTGTVRMYDENGEETNVKTMDEFPRYSLTWSILGGDSKDGNTNVNFYYKKPETPERIRVYDWGAGNPLNHCVKSVNISSGNEYAMMHASAFMSIDNNNAPFMKQRYNADGSTTSTLEIQTKLDKPTLVSGLSTGNSDRSVIDNMKNTICKGNITILGDPSIKFQGKFQPYTYPIYLNIILPNRSNGEFSNCLNNIGNSFQYQMSGYYIITKITHNISSSGFVTTLEVMRYPGSGKGAY